MAFLTFRHRFIASQIATQSGASNITLLMLHGTGGTETDLLDMGRVIAPKAALLSPRGKVLENGMSRFFRRLAEGVFDLDDLKLNWPTSSRRLPTLISSIGSIWSPLAIQTAQTSRPA